MVCFATRFLQPNSSDVAIEFIAVKAPEQVPKIPVLMYTHPLPWRSKKTAMGMGIIRSIVNAGLAITDFSLDKQMYNQQNLVVSIRVSSSRKLPDLVYQWNIAEKILPKKPNAEDISSKNDASSMLRDRVILFRLFK